MENPLATLFAAVDSERAQYLDTDPNAPTTEAGAAVPLPQPQPLDAAVAPANLKIDPKVSRRLAPALSFQTPRTTSDVS